MLTSPSKPPTLAKVPATRRIGSSMLDIVGDALSDRSFSNCQGTSRRSFLRAGALGLGGLTLQDLMRLKAAGGVRSSGDDKCVILLWLSGGPGHMETWD